MTGQSHHDSTRERLSLVDAVQTPEGRYAFEAGWRIALGNIRRGGLGALATQETDLHEALADLSAQARVQ